MLTPTEIHQVPTVDRLRVLSAWRTARARTDLLIALLLIGGFVALSVFGDITRVLPVLSLIEVHRAWADELLVGLLLVVALAIIFTLRRVLETDVALREANDAQAMTRLSFDDNPQPMWIIDINSMHFLAVNTAACTRYGWSKEEFLGDLTLRDIRPPDTIGEFSEVMGQRDDLKPVHGSTHWTKDGRRFRVDLLRYPVKYEGHDARLAVPIDVTEREQLAEQKRRSLARFEAVFNTLAAGIVESEQDGRIVQCNEVFAQMVGRTRDDLIGAGLPSITHPEDVEGAERRRGQVAAGDVASYSQTKRYVRPDGQPVWTLVTVSRVLTDDELATPRLLSVVVDMSEHRRVEEQADQALERLALTLEAVGEGLWDWNLVSDDCFLSPALNRLLGYLPDEMPPHISSWRLRIHPEDARKVEAVLQAHLRGETTSYETEHRMAGKDGTFRWVLDRGRVVRRAPDGTPLRMVGTMVDISAHRDLEDQLRQAQKMEAVGQLAGGVAHDFNNLLTVIRTGLELALTDAIPEQARADLREVELATERASSLTSQLLVFSRRGNAQPRPISLNDAVDDLARLVRRVLPEDIGVRRQLESECSVLADPGHVGQALLNLAVNARDAMPEGGMLSLATFDRTVMAGSPEARDGVAPGNYGVITVTDTGIGMDADVRSHIFEPFFTTKPLGKGTGLGLASVFGAVKQIGGAIRVESTPGVGTGFFLYFPVVDSSRPQTEEAFERTLPGGSELVLVVEDEPAVRSVAARLLASHGYRVREAANGVQALIVLQAEPGIACVLTDIVMPEMPGSALAAIMKEQYPRVPVVVMSAHAHDVLAQFPLPPKTVVIEKPFTGATMLEAIRAAIDTHPATTHPANTPPSSALVPQ